MYSFLLIIILLSMTILTSSFRLSNRLIRSPLKISMMSSNSNNSKKFILEYQYVSDILEKRVPYRSEHLALAEDLEKQGKIIAAGPFTPPTGYHHHHYQHHYHYYQHHYHHYHQHYHYYHYYHHYHHYHHYQQ